MFQALHHGCTIALLRTKNFRSEDLERWVRRNCFFASPIG
ncbi:hypothetical protein THTE_4162 [Thermogutta terrifontis]|uniref:Uncharacterized protein n=1 Tax=Thermogutta terrifontis TaxID=1331910 RepID=A0A286RLC8_9BACT|nr:hypothetical protein THTE_4162 [Thermogutta terrifontis]